VSDVVSREGLLALVDEWLGAGTLVSAPKEVKPGLFLYSKIAGSGDVALDGFIRPRNSVKDVVFPRHEALCKYKYEGQQLEVSSCEPVNAPHIVLGARPCDAAALTILDKVFNWDFADEFYTARRENTTIVTLACATHDDSCFCTSVDLGPADTKGSDAMLLPLSNGGFEVRAITEKGKALFQGKTQASKESAPDVAGPERRFEPDAIRAFLEASYDHPIWADLGMRCMGCGACAYTCPTCHCFDIVDEGNAAGGTRVRNWDACQFGMFTLHASGHNPRQAQQQRQRQRVQHKFRIYPEKFGEILCTGCGNCTRNCPVGLGMLNAIKAVALAASGVESEVAQ